MDTVLLDSSNTKITPNQYGYRSYFGTEVDYNGTPAFIIPKSFVERGFVAGNTQYWNKNFLNKDVLDYIKPIAVDENLAKELPKYINNEEFGKSPNTIPGWQAPDYSGGAYIIGADTPGYGLATGMGYGDRGLSKFDFSSQRGFSPITGVADVGGNLTYVGNQTAPGTTGTYTTYGEGTEGIKSQYTYKTGRGGFLGDLAEFIDNLGPLTLALNFVYPGAGTALYAGRQVAQGNWGNAVLAISLANVPGADGTTTSGFEGTFLEIPSIAEATQAIQSTLGVSATAASAIMSGALQTVASGGNIEDALKNIATSYIGSSAGKYVGDLVKNQGFKDLSTIAANVTKNATSAWLKNENVVDAAKSGFISSAIPIALKEIPAFDKLSDTQKTSITRIASQAAMMPNANLGDILKTAGINLAVDSVLGENSTYKTLPPMYQDLIRNSIISVAQDRPLDSSLSKFLNSQAQQQVKQYESKAQYLNAPIPTKEELKDRAAASVEDAIFKLKQAGTTYRVDLDGKTYGDEYNQLVKDILGPDAPPYSYWSSSPYWQLAKQVGYTNNDVSEKDIATALYQYRQQKDNSLTTDEEAIAYFNAMLGRNPTPNELSQVKYYGDEASAQKAVENFDKSEQKFIDVVGRKPTEEELRNQYFYGDMDYGKRLLSQAAQSYVNSDDVTKFFMDKFGRVPTQKEFDNLLAIAKSDDELTSQVADYKKAVDAGFPDTETYKKYSGDAKAYQENEAKQEGFSSYATKVQFGGDLYSYLEAKPDIDARALGFPDYETQQQYGGNVQQYLEAKKQQDWYNNLSPQEKSFQNQIPKESGDEGFTDFETYKKYNGDYNAYVAAQNESSAKQTGFPDYATQQQFNGDLTAYKSAQDELMAKTAKFPDFATYKQYSGDLGLYQSALNEKAAKEAGFPDFATQHQYGGSLDAYKTAQNESAAKAAGFPDYSTQQEYKGDLGAYTTAKNEAGAKEAGFPDYATQQQYGGDKTAYTTAQNNAAAKTAGFPDFETQTRFGNNVNEYKAVQEGWQSLGEKQAAAGYEITSPQKYQDFISGKTEEDKVVQMLKDRGIPATPERVADIMKSWDFNPTTPNVGFSDAFTKSDKLNISNSRADSVQEAAALAKSLGYSTFNFGGSDYKLNTAAPGQNPYDFFASFGEAFKAARKDLGDGQVFQWTDPQTGKTGYFTTNLAGEKVTEGGFDASVTQSAKSRLLENIEDMKTNPADLNAKDMAKFVDQFANATPAQRAALLNGSYSSTFKVINDALTTQKTVLDNTAEAIKSGRLDLSKPIEGTGSIKPSDVTNYRQILSSMGTNIATDIASTALTGANIVGSALGLDTSDIEKTQKLMSTDKNKQMDKLVGLEKNAAAGFASAIESAFSFALGGAPAAIGVLTSFAANNAWLEGKEAGLSNQDNAIRTATMASIEAAGEAIGIPGLSRLMKGVPMTGNPAEIVNAVKNFSLGMGNQQVSELVSTAASFAVDKFANFGLGKNATYQDFADALKDTVLTTAFAVGGTGTIGQASRALQATSTEPTTQLWSQNLPDEIWNRIKDSGVSQSEVDALKSNLRSSFGSDNYTVQQIQENFETKLKQAGFTDQEISRIAEPAALNVIADQAKTSLEKAGVPKDYVDTLANLTATQIYNNEDLPSTFNNLSTVFQAYGFNPLDANLITNQTLTGTDVKQVVTDQLKAAGYNPTQAEVDNLIIQNATAKPADIAASVTSYAAPRTVTKEEARAALVSSGLSSPTDAQINALVGQYDQNLLQSLANTTAGDISAQLSSTEKAAFARDAALSKTLNDISAQVTANQNAGMNADQALSQAITQVATSVGSTKNDLLNQIGQTEQGLKDQITNLQQKSAQDISGVKTQLGVVESSLSDKIAANEASGMARDQAIEKAVTEVAQSVGQSKSDLLALIGQTQENLTQQYASGQLQLEGKLSTLDEASQQRYQALSEDQKLQAASMAQQGKDLTQAISDVSTASQQQITGVENKLSEAIEAAKQSGLQGDAALQSAIGKVAGDLGTTKDGLLAQIGATETSLRQDFATQIGGVRTDVAALQAQLTDQGKSLLAQLTQQGMDYGTALQQAVAAQQQQVTNVQKSLTDAMAANEAAGLSRDQATAKAIEDVATSLGTTKDALLTRLGTTEGQLRSEMQAGQALTASQIAGLESQLTEQGRSLVSQLQQQGVSYQKALSDAIAAQNAQMTAGQQQTAEQIAGVKDSLTAQITANEQAGLSRDEATTKAINDLSSQMGVDKQTLMSQLGTTEQALRTELQSGLAGVTKTFQEQYNALNAAQKAQFDAMVQQGASTQAALAQVQAGLQQQITTGQQQTAQQIAALNQSLSDKIAANEQAGLGRDDAINKAVQDVATSVGTTKDALLAQLGQTEAGLQQKFTAGQAQTQAQIAQLDAATQAKFAQMSEAQKAQALQLAQTTKDLQGSINTVAEQTAQQIAGVSTDLQAKLAASDAATQAAFAQMTAAQQAEAAARVQQGQDLQSAIAASQQAAQQQITGVQQALQAQLSQQNAQTQQAFANMSAAQQQEVAARIQQGQDLQAAISGVQQSLGQQITGGLSAISQDFQNRLASSDAATQAAFSQMSAAQQAEAQARVQQGQDLQAAISAASQATQQQITGGLAALSQDFQGKLAASDAATQAAFAQMNASQQAEAQARVQQGQDLQGAIAASSAIAAQQLAQAQAALEGQLSAQGKQFFDALRQQGVDYNSALNQAMEAQSQQFTAGQQALSGQLGALSQASQQQYANLNAAQQQEVAARVAQGQSLQNALTSVQESFSQQLTQQGQQTQQQIGNLSAQTQAQYQSLNDAQRKEVEDRVAQGQSLESAIGGVSGQLSSLQKELEAQKAAEEAYRKAQEEKAAQDAAKAAQSAAKAAAQSRMSAQSGVLAGLAGLAGTAAVADEEFKPLLGTFLTSKGGQTGYKGLLQDFQQEVEGQPNMADNTMGRQESNDMAPYYSYGNETSLGQILGQENDQQQFFASGGLATPLMAAGGTTGTRYGKYAAGGVPRGIPRSGGHSEAYPGVSPLMAAGGKMRVDFRRGDAVTGPGDGQSDDIPAMLADGEFVFPADVVAALGNGSTKAGSDKLYDMMHSIRAHVRSAKPKDLPPEIKSPLDFLKTSKSSKKRRA